MCRYCNKLKELNKKEFSEYVKILESWRRRDKEARELIKNLVQLQCFSLNTQRRLLDEADEFVKCNWIGK